MEAHPVCIRSSLFSFELFSFLSRAPRARRRLFRYYCAFRWESRSGRIEMRQVNEKGIKMMKNER